jgi:hypothetical protein
MQYATTRSILRWIHIVFCILSGKHIAIGPLGSGLKGVRLRRCFVRYGSQADTLFTHA